MNYPLISEYIEAIRFAEDNFDKLSNLRPVLDNNGNPVMSSGNFAVVFKMKDIETDKLYAIKCFTRDQEERAERYREIIKVLDEIKSSYFVPTQYYDKELFVDTSQDEEKEFPVLVMDWVEGTGLEEYIQSIKDNDEERELLAYNFQKLVCWLLPKHFAHGDFKPDNIIVQDDGTIVLIDYDGMFVPSFYGRPALELGTPTFRHKNRTIDDFNEFIDDYAAVFILLVLKIYVTSPKVIDIFLSKAPLLDIFIGYTKFLNDSQIAPIMSAYIMVANNGYLDRSLISSLIVSRVSFNLKKEMDLLYSARMGNAKEMVELARLYERGFYAAKNVDKSLKWYELALKLGNNNAACGFCICLRRDPDISTTEYNVIFERLYQRGCNFAYCRKGELFNSNGDLQLAVDRGFVPALFNLGVKSEFKEKDKNKAIEYYTKAAEQGYTVAVHALARLYREYAVESIKCKDLSKAIYWLEEAAKLGDVTAMDSLGKIYFTEDKYKDFSKAINWWTKAAETGASNAQSNIALCYYLGNGVEKDIVKAVYWWLKAAEAGVSTAQCNLGSCYYLGKGVEKDFETAVHWWSKAAENNSYIAMRSLAICYFNGIGVSRSIEMSDFWLRKAFSKKTNTTLTTQQVLEEFQIVTTLLIDEFRAKYNNNELWMAIKGNSVVLKCGQGIVYIVDGCIPKSPAISCIRKNKYYTGIEHDIWILHEAGAVFAPIRELF